MDMVWRVILTVALFVCSGVLFYAARQLKNARLRESAKE